MPKSSTKQRKFPEQPQSPPGVTNKMQPVPDHGEESYVGSGKLVGKVALITGADSGIGRAVAIAFAREGADIVLSYLNEHHDARSTAELIEQAGRKCVVASGDITSEDHCNSLVQQTVSELGGIDILVNNAAFQRTYAELTDISTEEWDTTMRTNIYAPFFLSRAAAPRMKPGS